MDERTKNGIASDIDDLIVDVEELQEDANKPDVATRLKRTQSILERAAETLDEVDDDDDK